MNKTELTAAIAEKAGMTKKDADAALQAFTAVVTEEVANGGKVQLVGFGTFERTERAAHTGKNPRTGEILEVPASRAVKFKVGAEFKKKVNA